MSRRHSREGGNPSPDLAHNCIVGRWIPASAGMTAMVNSAIWDTSRPALRRQVQDRPERGDVRRVAGILAGVGHLPSHLAHPEEPHLTAVAAIDDQRRIFAIRLEQVEIAGIIVADRLDEVGVAPAPLLREGELAFDRAARQYLVGDALLDVGGIAIDRADPVGTHRAGPFAFGPIHPIVADQGSVAKIGGSQR